MLTAIQSMAVILSIVVNFSHYDTPDDFIQLTGYAINEYYCKQAPKEIRYQIASCTAHCAVGDWWVEYEDDEMRDLCREIGESNAAN